MTTATSLIVLKSSFAVPDCMLNHHRQLVLLRLCRVKSNLKISEMNHLDNRFFIYKHHAMLVRRCAHRERTNVGTSHWMLMSWLKRELQVITALWSLLLSLVPWFIILWSFSRLLHPPECSAIPAVSWWLIARTSGACNCKRSPTEIR